MNGHGPSLVRDSSPSLRGRPFIEASRSRTRPARARGRRPSVHEPSVWACLLSLHEPRPDGVLVRDGGNVYRTYFTNGRGVDALGSNWTFLDPTPLGRQENWEDSPDGYPQAQPYEWWRRHDEYDSS